MCKPILVLSFDFGQAEQKQGQKTRYCYLTFDQDMDYKGNSLKISICAVQVYYYCVTKLKLFDNECTKKSQILS